MCCQAQYIFLHQSTLELLNNKGNSQSIWFVSYSALEKMDSLDAMEGKYMRSYLKKQTNMQLSAHLTRLYCSSGDVELEWEETTM